MTLIPPEATRRIKCQHCGREIDEESYCDCQDKVKSRAFDMGFSGELDCSEADLPEAKSMLNDIANEIKSKFNRGAFSRHSEYAVIKAAETEIHSPEICNEEPGFDAFENI